MLLLNIELTFTYSKSETLEKGVKYIKLTINLLTFNK